MMIVMMIMMVIMMMLMMTDNDDDDGINIIYKQLLLCMALSVENITTFGNKCTTNKIRHADAIILGPTGLSLIVLGFVSKAFFYLLSFCCRQRWNSR